MTRHPEAEAEILECIRALLDGDPSVPRTFQALYDGAIRPTWPDCPTSNTVARTLRARHRELWGAAYGAS